MLFWQAHGQAKTRQHEGSLWPFSAEAIGIFVWSRLTAKETLHVIKGTYIYWRGQQFTLRNSSPCPTPNKLSKKKKRKKLNASSQAARNRKGDTHKAGFQRGVRMEETRAGKGRGRSVAILKA